MQKIALLLLCGLVFLSPNSKAQVSDDDEATAYRLKRKYPDERSAVLSDMILLLAKEMVMARW
jgi:hypothetical protein